MISIHFQPTIEFENYGLDGKKINSHQQRIKDKVSWSLGFFFLIDDWIWLFLYQKKKKVAHQNKLPEIKAVEILK